jgi:2-keto-3-deoxy-L-arabinonate dehydratase
MNFQTARATIAGRRIGNTMVRKIGQRDGAVQAWERILPLIHYKNRQCGLAGAKHLLHAGGIIRSPRCRAPFPELSPVVGRELLELARRKDALVLKWAG